MFEARNRQPATGQTPPLSVQAAVIACARRGAAPEAVARTLNVRRAWVQSVLFRYRVDPDARAAIDAHLGDAA